MDNFYKKLGPISSKNISIALDIDSNAPKISNVKFSSFTGLNNCSENDLSFIYDNYEIPEKQNKPKGIIISNKRKDSSFFDDTIKFIVHDVHSSVAKISNLFLETLTLMKKKVSIKQKFKMVKILQKLQLLKMVVKLETVYLLEKGQ